MSSHVATAVVGHVPILVVVPSGRHRFGAEAQMGLKVQPTHCRTSTAGTLGESARVREAPHDPIKFEYSIVLPEIIWKNKISCTRINKYARNAIHKLKVLKLNWILSKYLHEKISWEKIVE